MTETYRPPTGYEPDASNTPASTYDDRDLRAIDDDEPTSCWVPIEERPENTHMGYSEGDPAIDEPSDVATWDEEVTA